MSDFKFACPVCGQHLTAHSSTSGEQIACPTCFRKIIVPQAPASPDAKLILSASQVSQPRPTSLAGAPDLGPLRQSRSWPGLGRAVGWIIVVAAVAGAVLVLYRAGVFPPTQLASRSPAPHSPGSIYPVPTNISWALDLGDAPVPDTLAVGRVHGLGFSCEHASLKGGTLTLAQGQGGPPDLKVSVRLFARQSEDLSGKSIEVSAERRPPLPRVVLGWKDDQAKPRNQKLESGYALKLIFGQVVDGRLPGKLYLCLPDESKSFVAGSFEAEIRKPTRPPPPSQPY